MHISLRTACGSLLAALLLSFGLSAHAQFNASLSGTVTDTTGGAIPNATVTLTSEGTHQAVTKTTSATGVYQFPSLAPDHYDLVITASGFKPSTFTAIAVEQDTPRNFDVKLAVGTNNETVTVNASDVVALQTADGSVSTVLDNEQLEKIPEYGRDPYNLIRTAPGITGDAARAGNGNAVFMPNSVGPGGSNFGIGQAENEVQIVADGQRLSDNNYLIDGVSVNDLGYGGATVVTPNIEAIGSINVTSTSFSAEDGRNSGAQIHVVTKSGTNHFHGSANFLYDEPGLNAFNKYGGPSGQPDVRVQTKRRDVAASLGGPIWRDKLFGFFSFEHSSETNQSYESQYIETPQFDALIHSQRPGSIADQIVSSAGNTPRVHAILNQSCTSPYVITPCAVVGNALDIGSLYGTEGTYVPNADWEFGGGLDGVPDVQYVQLALPGASTVRQFNGRVDYFATPKDQFALSFYLTKLFDATQGAQSRPDQDVLFNPSNNAATFIYIHTFAPSLLNEFRMNFTRFYENGVQDGIDGGSNFGIPYINIQDEAFSPSNDVQYGINFAPTTPAIFAENQYEIRDTVTKTFGAHTLKIGFEARDEQDNTNQLGGSRPGYSIAGMWNFANDAPIYEEIYADPATGGPANSARYLHDHYYAWFVQHDWKVTQELTLNMGLRWEYFEPLYNKGMEINYPVLGPAGSELSGAALLPHNHFYNSQFDNYSPKFGFAYSPAFLHGKSVFRGGFAMAYNRLDDVLFDPAIEDGPGIFNYGLCCAENTTPGDPNSLAATGITYVLGSSTSPKSYAPNPALRTAINSSGLPASGATVEAYGADPNLKTPYSYLYALEFQQDLGRQLVLSVGYQGSTGRHYTRLVNENFIYSNVNSPFYALYMAHSDSNMYYNALNVHGTKHYKNGISLDAVYTWSKDMDQITNGDGADASGNQTYPQDNSTELGPSDFDVKHRVVASGTYDFHPYHGDSLAERALINGWEINGIFTAHTGFPWTPVTYAINGLPSAANTGTISPVRPTSYTGSYSPTCSASAFRDGTTVSGVFGLGYRNAAGQKTDANGNVVGGYRPGIGRNSFRGPCYEQIDAGIAKDFKLKWLGEQGGLRLQAQAFNVFNKLNYSPFDFSTASTQIDGGSNEVTSCPSGSPSTAVCPAYATVVPGQATFQRPSGASAGRVIELDARIRF
ncbi:MAG TPA: carboxypeptidase regulatory-like domain-containing protein [Acidobacteriaceae bacterium]|nr:carboxypeptidase regulatory-like domain-containing protein [Acidobacteriaceae bacterium]